MVVIIHNHFPMDDGGVCLTCGPGDGDQPEDKESKDGQDKHDETEEPDQDSGETSEE